MEGTEVILEEIEWHGCEQRAGETAANVPVLGLSPTPSTDAIIPRPSIPLHKASAWEWQ